MKLALALFATLTAGFLWERGVLSNLREENRSLRSAEVEILGLVAENADLAKLRAADGPPVDGSDNTELLRLRNEVRQLRLEQQEADRIRKAIQLTTEELKTVPSPRARE